MQRRTWIRSFALFGIVTMIAPAAVAQEEGAEPEGLNIREVQVGTALVGGLVAEPQLTISRDAGRIFAVVRLNNPSREATTIRVSFEHAEGPHRGGVSLDIPARRRYRTVARFGAAHPPGRYRVVIRTEDGVELGSVDVTITE